MAEESVAQFLGRRERELISQIAALRGQLAPKEAELAHVQHMRSFLPGGPNTLLPAGLSPLAKIYAENSPLATTGTGRSDSSLSNSDGPKAGALARPPEGRFATPDNPYAKRTIKDLSIQALLDAFPHGATIAELKDFVRTGYDRTVDLGSLRTQLHRLKAAGILGQDPSTDTWNFRDGKRALYQMYDHPSSRRDMSELQDDPNANEPDEGFLDAVRALAWRDEDDKK